MGFLIFVSIEAASPGGADYEGGSTMPAVYEPEEFGIELRRSFERGPLNSLGDVPGVTVGHCTVDTKRNKTGVTVILPCVHNPFVDKLTAASAVINGFGKTMGTIQIGELGTLETPIALTNTLNVGLVHDALTGYMMDRCGREGVELLSVNPVVAECNDCTLNDIRHRAVGKEEVLEAISSAGSEFLQGDVGAGKGMICHGLKGGIGSASRRLYIAGRTFTLAVLVLTNHGRLEDLVLSGRPFGRELAGRAPSEDKGSCILILATDLPLSSRQLGRILRRAPVGLARLGSFIGNGSGEIAVGFSTACPSPWSKEKPFLQKVLLNESLMDLPFEAMAEAVQEAVLRSMLCADTVTGFDGTVVRSLREYLV